MRIIKRSTEAALHKIECQYCGCIFECSDDEFSIDADGIKFITCPDCETDVDMDGNECREEVTRNNISFPKSFYYFDPKTAEKIGDDRINVWVREIVDDLYRDPDNIAFSERGSGDTIVTGLKFSDGEITIHVCKNYYDTSIYA